MAAQVVRGEAHVVDAELLAGGVLGGAELGEAVVAQHVQQRRLAGIVEAEKENLAALVSQPYCSVSIR